ncbi:MAG: aspartate kinase, partial [Bacteroidales bacterium]|nr:aspartate kinase [Bacteroidales bacterium]
MKVIKFGGTSVGSAEGLLNIKQIVSAEKDQVLVVVSAISGMTDLLIQTSRMAASGDLGYQDNVQQMRDKHARLIAQIFSEDDQAAMLQQTNTLLDELSNIFQGVCLIQDLSAKSEAVILSYGERISSILVSKMLKAKHLDARELIKTEFKYNKNVVNFDQTAKAIYAQCKSLPQVTVMGGFISSSAETGETTNLGRGGSDYTAAIMAAELKATVLEIWTDVDGFMTADPKVINNAYVIEKLSFVEAMELCNFGAKVLYPPTIFPVYHDNIPIRIKNTFNPEAPGTFISREHYSGEGKAIKGISSISDSSLITVQGMGMVGVIGVNYRIFRALAQSGISVFIVSQASS